MEIDALRYNAPVAMQGVAMRLGTDPEADAERAERPATGFQRDLRADGVGRLDLLDGPAGDDASIRPNRILAANLAASPWFSGDRAGVAAACGPVLPTSQGLRSLAPSDAASRGHDLGGVWERDGAYRQGPVRAWPLGHDALAEYRVTGDAGLALSRLAPMADRLGDAGLGSVSEIFDGDRPHIPHGAPLQTWFVACTLEARWRSDRAEQRPDGGTP